MATRMNGHDLKRLLIAVAKKEQATFKTAVLVALYEETRDEALPSSAWVLRADQRLTQSH